jgi:AraC-like DNA-binding protein
VRHDGRVLPQLHSLPAEDRSGCGEAVGRLPRRSLRPWLAGYSGFRAAGDGYLRRRMLPLDVTTVIIDFARPVAVITGPRHTPLVYDQDDWRYGVAIGLTPAGVAAFLGLPVPELVGATLGAETLLGRRAYELADRLGGLPDWPTRFAVLDGLLAGWLRPRDTDALVTRAWWRLHESPGRLTIGALAGELGVSRRRLEVGFRRHVGLAPKTVARIARFQYAVHLLTRRTAGPAVAAECGYADQPHLTREVRALAGITPTELCAFLQYIDDRHR